MWQGRGALATPLLLLLVCCAATAYAITPTASPSEVQSSQAQESDLNTYAIIAIQLELSVVGAGRPGTTRVSMQLTADKLQQAVPVITPSKAGVMHN